MNWYRFSQVIDSGLIMKAQQLADAGDIHKINNLLSKYTMNLYLYRENGDEKWLEKSKEAEKEVKKYIAHKLKEKRDKSEIL